MSILAEAPPRSYPSSSAVLSISTAHTNRNHVVISPNSSPVPLRGIIAPYSSSSASLSSSSSSSASSTSHVTSISQPISTSTTASTALLPPSASTLANQMSLITSLATVPPHLLQHRAHTDHWHPILQKGDRCVYVEKEKDEHKSPSSASSASKYVIRPNFRALHESDDPSSHHSLTYITSIPNALASQRNGSTAGTHSSSQHRKHALSLDSSSSSASSLPSSRLLFLRPPIRSSSSSSSISDLHAQHTLAKQAKEQKQRQEDYDNAGLKPRPIKSVAALLQQAQLNTGGLNTTNISTAVTSLAVNSGSTFPPHNARMKSTPSGASTTTNVGVFDADLALGIGGKPSTSGAAATARFRGLKLQKSSAHALSPALSGVRQDGGSDDDEEEERKIELVDDPLTSSSSSVIRAALNANKNDASKSLDVTSAGGKSKEAVVVAANAGSTCCICTTSDFVEPWISSCQHICCSECWITWLNENPEKQCPECEKEISLEDLRPIALCPICFNIPKSPWTSPCKHTACKDCWKVWLEENPVCSECQEPVDKTLLPA